jgi:hypothetical protein
MVFWTLINRPVARTDDDALSVVRAGVNDRYVGQWSSWGGTDMVGMTMGISRTTALACGLGISILAGGAAGPAQAALVSGSATDWSISVDIPDFTWDHYGCSEAPARITTVGNPGEWSVVMPVRLTGSGHYSDTLMASGETAQTVEDVVNLCPSDLNGTYLVSGYAQGGNPETQIRLETQFVVSPMASNTALAQITPTSSRTQFTGVVTAASPTLGQIGGKPGTSVQIQRQDTEGWVGVVTTKLDNLGNFKVSAPRAYAGGTVFRAYYLGATEVAPSVSTPLVAPIALPSTPQITSVLRAPGSARVAWRSQGSNVTYKYRISAPGRATYGEWKQTSKNFAMFPKLVRGAKYRVQVVAVNAAGESKTRTTTFRSK